MPREEKSQSRTRGTPMAEVIGANDRAALAAVEDLPVLNVADLDADPHGMFRRYRAAYPFVGHETGGYLLLRHADIERLGNDPRTAASETVHPDCSVSQRERSLISSSREC